MFPRSCLRPPTDCLALLRFRGLEDGQAIIQGLGKVLLGESVHQEQKVKQIVVPETLRLDMFKAFPDDLEHQKRDGTLRLMKRRLYWPGMDKFIG